jgi:signal transduction histidine kinase
MAVLLLLGTAFAGICIAFLFWTVLAPVQKLTRAARLTNAARNLETALGPVRSTLDLLKSEPSPLTPQQELLLEGVRRQAEILDRSAKNLLALSRGEELRQELHPEPTASRELIDAAVQEIAVRYRAKKVELAIDVDPEASRVLADRERVGVVLSALLNNALVHTAAGGKVTVHAEPWEGRARFSVADTGDGIPPAHLERIFEPFYQVPGTEDLGGVGLGLTIAREIVQDHGGEIHGESEGEGRGATFWFTLPATVG